FPYRVRRRRSCQQLFKLGIIINFVHLFLNIKWFILMIHSEAIKQSHSLIQNVSCRYFDKGYGFYQFLNYIQLEEFVILRNRF
ncbi:MAG TPA: hypothetical protein VLA74_14915, partial [Nitrososphaeraceae archaeon]|nr:hypothetical protein [Nitrososphaeraceae archaeon]